MNGINLKGFGVHSFMIKGLTARWGIGENRAPSIWDNNLIGYWDARDLPNGAVSTVANKATLATKAPDLTVTGATMADGTLQFDGVDDYALTEEFMFPERFTAFWDTDWLGTVNASVGISHGRNLVMYNRKVTETLYVYIKSAPASIPNTSVGLSTNGNIYAPDGNITPYGETLGTETQKDHLCIGSNSWAGAFTQMGFRQLLIFNKELSPTEVNDVLRVMFPV